jgi:hypothetical protein
MSIILMAAHDSVNVVTLNEKHSTLKSIFVDGKTPTKGWLKTKLSSRSLKKPQKRAPNEEKQTERLQYNNFVESIRVQQYPMLNGEGSMIAHHQVKH